LVKEMVTNREPANLLLQVELFVVLLQLRLLYCRVVSCCLFSSYLAG